MGKVGTSRLIRALIVVVTVFLYVCIFPPFNFPELVYIAFVPILSWGYFSKSRKQILKVSMISGVLSWILIVEWLRHLSFFLPIILGAVLGVFVGTWLYWSILSLKRIFYLSAFSRIIVLLGLSGLWVVLEWLRGWLFTGFPWLPLSASLWQRPGLLQVVEYTGAHGVSFALVFFNLCLAVYLIGLMNQANSGDQKVNKKHYFPLELYIAAIMLFGLIALYMTEFPKSEDRELIMKIGTIQPHIPSSMKWDESKVVDNMRILSQETRVLSKQNPDLILWPETAVTTALNQDFHMQSWVSAISSYIGIPIITGAIAQEEGKYFNAVFEVTPNQGILPNYYAKRKIVPFGEYVPWRFLMPFLEKYVPTEYDLAQGKSVEPLIIEANGKKWRAGTIVCFEDVFTNLVRDTVKAGVDFIIVLTNSGWYGENGMSTQHAANAVLRAIEYRRPIVRCGNYGWSGWIDEYGFIQGVMEKDGDVHFQGGEIFEVAQDKLFIDKETFYSTYGNYFVIFSCIFLILGGIIYVRSKL